MNRINNYIRISQLIAKEVNYNLKEEEEQELNDWLNDRSENRQLYDRIRSRENFLEWDQKMHQVNVEEGWNRFDEMVNPKWGTVVMQTIFRYAAVVMIPLFLGGVGYLLYNDVINLTGAEQVVKKEQSKLKARLILADGKEIDLEDVRASAMQEKDGTQIEKSERILKYQERKEAKELKTLLNTVEIPRGGEYQLYLADGTKVYLNSMSSLTFPVQFTGKTREVQLSGEAYFEVTKDVAHPFVVNVLSSKIEVLGTSFNVKSYKEEKEIVTTLVEGSVRVKTCGNKQILLKPGQQASEDEETGELDVRDVDVALYTSWKNGVFLFKNQRLEDIMIELSRWYDLKVFYKNSDVKEYRFGGHFNRNVDISSILEMFELTRKVDAEINGKAIVFGEK